MKYTNKYLVEFADMETPNFVCWADDTEHAIEQAENAYPKSLILDVWIVTLVWHDEVNDDEENLRAVNDPSASWNLPK